MKIEISAIRAQGSGGQKVNKVSAAIHLRFDISASSLPEFYKEQLHSLKDKSKIEWQYFYHFLSLCQTLEFYNSSINAKN